MGRRAQYIVEAMPGRIAWALALVAAVVAGRPPGRTLTERATGMTLALVPAGRFTMGSRPSERGRNADETPHEVTIARPFFLGRHEVTQREWRFVMGTSPSAYAGCDECPVERVNDFDVDAFLSRLNRRERRPAPAADADRPRPSARFRLPTEAEWEYACRAGTDTPFSTGENLTTDQANYNGRFPYRIVRARGVPRPSRESRQLPAQRVGPLRPPRERVGVDLGLVCGVGPRPTRAEEGDPRRELVLRRQQRTLRAALHACAEGPRVQSGIPGGGDAHAVREGSGGSAMNAYCIWSMMRPSLMALRRSRASTTYPAFSSTRHEAALSAKGTA